VKSLNFLKNIEAIAFSPSPLMPACRKARERESPSCKGRGLNRDIDATSKKKLYNSYFLRKEFL
jgi:hypothetical protein